MSSDRIMILMGSSSDFDTMEPCFKILDEFGIDKEVHVASAHRTPAKVQKLVSTAPERGVQVIVCAAGLAAHLAGVVAAHTILPVIGVPMDGGALKGVDALYSTVQMPGGIPVASMGIGRHGAKNAAYFCVHLLALNDETVKGRLQAYRDGLEASIAKQNDEVAQKLS